MRYLNCWIDQLRWLRLKPMERLADMLIKHLDGILNYCRTKIPLGVVEAVNANIKALLRRGRDYRNLTYLLLKAQRLAATRTQLIAFQKAAQNGPSYRFSSRAYFFWIGDWRSGCSCLRHGEATANRLSE